LFLLILIGNLWLDENKFIAEDIYKHSNSLKEMEEILPYKYSSSAFDNSFLKRGRDRAIRAYAHLPLMFMVLSFLFCIGLILIIKMSLFYRIIYVILACIYIQDVILLKWPKLKNLMKKFLNKTKELELSNQ